MKRLIKRMFCITLALVLIVTIMPQLTPLEIMAETTQNAYEDDGSFYDAITKEQTNIVLQKEMLVSGASDEAQIGDVNADANINMMDVEAILFCVIDKVYSYYGDMNGDNKLDVTDAWLLMKQITNQDTDDEVVKPLKTTEYSAQISYDEETQTTSITVYIDADDISYVDVAIES